MFSCFTNSRGKLGAGRLSLSPEAPGRGPNGPAPSWHCQGLQVRRPFLSRLGTASTTQCLVQPGHWEAVAVRTCALLPVAGVSVIAQGTGHLAHRASRGTRVQCVLPRWLGPPHRAVCRARASVSHGWAGGAAATPRPAGEGRGAWRSGQPAQRSSPRGPALQPRSSEVHPPPRSTFSFLVGLELQSEACGLHPLHASLRLC